MTPETETLIARLEAKHKAGEWMPLLKLTNPDGPLAVATIREQAAEIAHLADQLDGCQHNWKQVTAENVKLRAEIERLRGVLGAVRTMVHYIFETGDDHESRKALEIIDIIHQALGEQP